MNIAILTNDHLWTYNLRKELIEAMISVGHKVTLVLPDGERLDYFRKIGCDFVDFPYEKHGVNFIKEFALYKKYVKVLKEINPDVVLTYTTKPNIYGSMACAKLKIPYIITITGVGRTMQSGVSRFLMKRLYAHAARKAFAIVFQNTENMNMFMKDGIYSGTTVLVPGSGVNTSYHALQPYPESDEVQFLFIGRLHADKGLVEYLEAASIIKKENPLIGFHVVGVPENGVYTEMVENSAKNGDIVYHGKLLDVRSIIGECHCTVLPSYYEGMANVLLESASAGRPLIATDISGCRETISDSKTGFICKLRSTDDLCAKMRDFINLSYDEKKKMGISGREKVLKEFDRDIVIKSYMKLIDEIVSCENTVINKKSGR